MKKVLVASMMALAALSMQGCAVTSGQSSVGEYVDDATITTRVKARMAEDPTVAAMRINVETLKGTVQLSGFATSQTEKDRAADIASKVPDVKSVRNNIVIRPPEK
ncbi:BON domain-containing protein [Pelomonas sp. CA6]|uniref:BON domain-containing protein n=1 Tax=Pelomonas sp. CA6 TaxID=2907999 RepID=UPI001F4C2C2D|nr:BON domain-containing protein [Pelomonas sp. CA6]MCH7344743.1 BON domain-containing protein [Pelomonas sp. CA6]